MWAGAVCVSLLACGGEARRADGSLQGSGGAASAVGGASSAGARAGSGGTVFGGGGRPGKGDAGGTAPPAEGVFCPSLGHEANEPLFVTREARKRTLIRADGSIHARHTLSFDDTAESFLEDGEGLVLAAIRHVIADANERPWELVRFDLDGNDTAGASGTVAAARESAATRAYPPAARLEGDRVAFDQADADTWVVGFDGSSQLRECEQRSPLGPAEEADWIGVKLQPMNDAVQFAFFNESTGACRRMPLSGFERTTTFLQGRFQFALDGEIGISFEDLGPSTAPAFQLFAGATRPEALGIYVASDVVEYLAAAPSLSRYDLRSRELGRVELPATAPATAIEKHGNRLIGLAEGVPVWSFDIVQERSSVLNVAVPSGEVSLRASEGFGLLSVDARPTTWVDLSNGEHHPFEIVIPEAATLEFVESELAGLVIADGVPVAHFDVAAGTASAIELGRSSGVAATLDDGAQAFVVLDGVPAFRVNVEDGEVKEIVGEVPAREATTERAGEHIIAFGDGAPRALLDRDAAELVPLTGETQVPSASKLISNSRFIVGLDERDWPVFRIDSSTRIVSAYAVAEPNDLVSLRDERYVESPGDSTYEEYYAPALSDALVLDDGSVAVALRDARQARLWSITPDDAAFQPLGRPFSEVLDLRWTATDHFFQIGADRGDCFCVPPKLRWKEGADADVMPVGAVQVVARAHPSLVIVRPDYLVEADPSGACIVEPRAPTPLVHDLITGTTLALNNAEGAARFLIKNGRPAD